MVIVEKQNKTKKTFNFSLRGKIFNYSTFFVLHKEMFNQDFSGNRWFILKTNVHIQIGKVKPSPHKM